MPMSRSSAPAQRYTGDSWLRCKDILFGSEYPEDRPTESQDRETGPSTHGDTPAEIKLL